MNTEDKGMITEVEIEDLLTRFENFQCQETFHDKDIYEVYLRSFNYYVATHERGQYDKGLSFANFVVGYLKAKLDFDQNSLI